LNATVINAPTIQGMGVPVNLAMTASVLTGVLTISFLGNNGAALSSTNPLLVAFQNVNATSGIPALVTVTSPLTMSTFTTGATLGASNGTAFRFWVCLFYQNATTVMPALINCSNSSQIFPLMENTFATTVAIGSTATSAGVFYSPNGTSVGNAPFRIAGYLSYGNGLATAGNFSTAPTHLVLYSAGMKKPGDIVQSLVTTTNVSSNFGTSSFSAAPLAISITPTAAPNLVRVESQLNLTNSSTVQAFATILRGGATQIGNITNQVTGVGGLSCLALDLPATSAAVTYAIGLKGSSCVFNPTLAGQVGISEIVATELMG
jgi:hypothetical protein